MTEARIHSRTKQFVEFGKPYVYLICPFCSKRCKAFTADLEKGKPCLCGAVHRNNGTTRKGGEK